MRSFGVIIRSAQACTIRGISDFGRDGVVEPLGTEICPRPVRLMLFGWLFAKRVLP
jgi:hypothetical protein